MTCLFLSLVNVLFHSAFTSGATCACTPVYIDGVDVLAPAKSMMALFSF